MDVHINRQSETITSEVMQPINEHGKSNTCSIYTRIFQPKLIINDLSRKKYGTVYINALREALFTHFERPYKTPEVPLSILQEGDNVSKYICKQCKDSFHHERSLEEHTFRGSWILGYWCTECFQECEHLAGKKLYCSKCIKLKIQKYKSLQTRGLKKCTKPGIVKIFFNPCQLLEHMQMHSSEKVCIHHLMLLPFPSGIGKEYFPHLKMISEALMDFMFLANLHIADWLLQNKIHKWWRMAKGDNPVANIIKRYPFEVQQIKQLLNSNSKGSQSANMNLGNLLMHESKKNNVKNTGNLLNKNKPSSSPSLSNLRISDTSEASNAQSTNDITFIACGLYDNEQSCSMDEQFLKSTNIVQSTSNSVNAVVADSNQTINSAPKPKISVKKFAKVPSLTTRTNNIKKTNPTSSYLNKINATGNHRIVTIRSAKPVNISSIIKNFPQIAGKVANKKIVLIHKNLPKDKNMTKLNNSLNNEIQNVDFIINKSNKDQVKLQSLNSESKSKQIIKSVNQQNLANNSKTKPKVIQKVYPIKSKHVQKSIIIKEKPDVEVPSAMCLKSKEQSNLFIETLKSSTKKVLQQFFCEDEMMFLTIKRNEKSGKRFLNVISENKDSCTDDIFTQRNKLFSNINKLNHSKLNQRINYIKAISRKYSEKLGILDDEVIRGHQKFISVLDKVATSSESKSQSVDDYFGPLINSSSGERCMTCSKITKSTDYIAGFTSVTNDLDYCLCYDLICYKCNTFQGSKERFEAHMRYHNNERPFDCPECNISFTSFQSLNVHTWTECFHPLILRILSCNICQIGGFCSLESMMNHYVIMHSIKVTVCNFCCMVFECKRFCISHMKKGHPESINFTDPLQLALCQLDDRVIPIEYYSLHMENHKCALESHFYKCKLCSDSNKLFNSKELIKIHIYQHHRSELLTFIDADSLNEILLMNDIQRIIEKNGAICKPEKSSSVNNKSNIMQMVHLPKTNDSSTSVTETVEAVKINDLDFSKKSLVNSNNSDIDSVNSRLADEGYSENSDVEFVKSLTVAKENLNATETKNQENVILDVEQKYNATLHVKNMEITNNFGLPVAKDTMEMSNDNRIIPEDHDLSTVKSNSQSIIEENLKINDVKADENNQEISKKSLVLDEFNSVSQVTLDSLKNIKVTNELQNSNNKDKEIQFQNSTEVLDTVSIENKSMNLENALKNKSELFNVDENETSTHIELINLKLNKEDSENLLLEKEIGNYCNRSKNNVELIDQSKNKESQEFDCTIVQPKSLDEEIKLMSPVPIVKSDDSVEINSQNEKIESQSFCNDSIPKIGNEDFKNVYDLTNREDDNDMCSSNANASIKDLCKDGKDQNNKQVLTNNDDVLLGAHERSETPKENATNEGMSIQDNKMDLIQYKTISDELDKSSETNCQNIEEQVSEALKNDDNPVTDNDECTNTEREENFKLLTEKCAILSGNNIQNEESEVSVEINNALAEEKSGDNLKCKAQIDSLATVKKWNKLDQYIDKTNESNLNNLSQNVDSVLNSNILAGRENVNQMNESESSRDHDKLDQFIRESESNKKSSTEKDLNVNPLIDNNRFAGNSKVIYKGCEENMKKSDEKLNNLDRYINENDEIGKKSALNRENLESSLNQETHSVKNDDTEYKHFETINVLDTILDNNTNQLLDKDYQTNENNSSGKNIIEEYKNIEEISESLTTGKSNKLNQCLNIETQTNNQSFPDIENILHSAIEKISTANSDISIELESIGGIDQSETNNENPKEEQSSKTIIDCLLTKDPSVLRDIKENKHFEGIKESLTSDDSDRLDHVFGVKNQVNKTDSADTEKLERFIIEEFCELTKDFIDKEKESLEEIEGKDSVVTEENDKIREICEPSDKDNQADESSLLSDKTSEHSLLVEMSMVRREITKDCDLAKSVDEPIKFVKMTEINQPSCTDDNLTKANVTDNDEILTEKSSLLNIGIDKEHENIKIKINLECLQYFEGTIRDSPIECATDEDTVDNLNLSKSLDDQDSQKISHADKIVNDELNSNNSIISKGTTIDVEEATNLTSDSLDNSYILNTDELSAKNNPPVVDCDKTAVQKISTVENDENLSSDQIMTSESTSEDQKGINPQTSSCNSSDNFAVDVDDTANSEISEDKRIGLLDYPNVKSNKSDSTENSRVFSSVSSSVETTCTVADSNDVSEECDSLDLLIRDKEQIKNTNVFTDYLDSSSSHNLASDVKECQTISRTDGIIRVHNFELKNLSLTDDEKINLSKNSVNLESQVEKSLDSSELQNENVKRLRSRSSNRPNSSLEVTKTKRKSKMKVTVSIDKTKVLPKKNLRESRIDKNIDPVDKVIGEKKTVKTHNVTVQKTRSRSRRRKEENEKNSYAHLDDNSDVEESTTAKKSLKRNRSENRLNVDVKKTKLIESLSIQMPTLRLIKTCARVNPVDVSNLTQSVPKLKAVNKYKIGFDNGIGKLGKIYKFKCHLCGDPLSTSWAVLSEHYNKKHAHNYELCTISPKLTRISNEDIVANTKKSDKKRTSSEELSTLKKRKRMSPKKTNDKPKLGPDRTSGLFVQLEMVVDGEGHFKCKKCDKKCMDMVELRQHIGDNHRIARKNLICLECGENFVVSPSLQMHLKAFHGIEDSIGYMNKFPAYAPDIDDFEEVAKTTVANQCHVCMAVFKDTLSVDKHLRVHGMAFLSRKRREARNAQLTTFKVDKFENKESTTSQEAQRHKSSSNSNSDKTSNSISPR